MHLWRRKWQPSPVFLPGESHEQRSLAGYSSWSRKESDTTEWLTCTRTHILCTDYIWMYLYTTNRNALHVFKTVSHCKSELAKIFPLALDFRDLFNNYSTNSFPYLQSISLYKYLAIYLSIIYPFSSDRYFCHVISRCGLSEHSSKGLRFSEWNDLGSSPDFMASCSLRKSPNFLSFSFFMWQVGEVLNEERKKK